MKTMIGLACLALAIFLTPDAYNAMVNGDSAVRGWNQATLLVPAAAAWAIGVWLVSTRRKPGA